MKSGVCRTVFLAAGSRVKSITSFSQVVDKIVSCSGRIRVQFLSRLSAEGHS